VEEKRVEIAVGDLRQPAALEQAVAEQVEILARVVGRPLEYLDVPEEKAREGMKKGGIPERVADALVEVMKDRRSGARGLLTRAVEQITKRSAKTFEEWCSENVAAFH
jgi:hypothetical protein